MQRDFKLDPNTHDLVLENGDFVYIETREEALAQRLRIRLKMFKGEYFADINSGVPYLANENNPIQLLGKNNKDLADAEIKRVILNTPDVSKIIRYSSNFTATERILEISFAVRTEGGSLVEVEFGL